MTARCSAVSISAAVDSHGMSSNALFVLRLLAFTAAVAVFLGALVGIVVLSL